MSDISVFLTVVLDSDNELEKLVQTGENNAVTDTSMSESIDCAIRVLVYLPKN